MRTRTQRSPRDVSRSLPNSEFRTLSFAGILERLIGLPSRRMHVLGPACRQESRGWIYLLTVCPVLAFPLGTESTVMADAAKPPEDQPNLLLTIRPLDLLAEDALKDKHNASRYQCTEMEEREVRETTPASFAGGARMDAHLNLTFDNPPKSFIKGWVFGSEPQTCDVVLGKWGFGVSREHFCISIDDHGQAIFQDTSTNGTTVVYTANQKDQEDLRRVLKNRLDS